MSAPNQNQGGNQWEVGTSGTGTTPTTHPDGSPMVGVTRYETREIILAQGAQAHDADLQAPYDSWRQANPNASPDGAPAYLLAGGTIFAYLAERLGSGFTASSPGQAEYTSEAQRVTYRIRTVQGRDAYKQALETENVHVIYQGHSRSGRGPCFEVTAGGHNPAGEHWEEGTGPDNGIFRSGFPYVPISISDIEHHRYRFAPVPTESPAPPSNELHPSARTGLSAVSLPEALRELVTPEFASPSHRYRGASGKILLRAGWTGTRAAPHDVGATGVRCKAWCLFGCSTRLHFYDFVRETRYKNWRRNSPPTTNFFYVTTNPADMRATAFWLRALLSYDRPNAFESWNASLEAAKTRANQWLNSATVGYTIY